MPTLYVENVPEELYKALRERAREHGTSIAAEVLILLKDSVPTAQEWRRRKELFNRAVRIRARRSAAPGPHLTAEQMQREDRRR
jgi:plasmid stability protein